MAEGITTILPVWFQEPGASALEELRRATESVLSQQCKIPIELLIVDDGSAAPVEPPINDPRIRVLRLSRNRGIAYALNAGLAQARFDLIARIDADDLWRPAKLATQLEMLDADPDLTLVASGMRLVHPDNPELDRDEIRGGDWPHTLELTKRIGCPFPHGSILARREVFEILGGYPQALAFQHAEDFALWSQWIRFFKVAICEGIFLEYAVSQKQISSHHATAQQQASHAAGKLLEVLKDGRTKVPQAVATVARSLGVNPRSASRILWKAWRFHSHIIAGPEIFEATLTLMPDRAVHREQDIHTLLAGRVFQVANIAASHI